MQMRPWNLWLGVLVLLGPARALEAGMRDDWNKMKRIVPEGYVCARATSPIVVDGRLDDAAWERAPWTHDFVDIEGDAKPRPRLRTRAKMLWDDTCFYVAAELEEPHVWATITQHDAVIFRDPDFEVFIDPDGDTHDYYEFEMNALNTGWDLLLQKPYKDGGPALNSWEIPGLKTAVHIRGTLNDPADHDAGWSIEIAFPWRALGEYAHRPAPPKAGDQWRVGFSRVEWEIEIIDGKYRKIPGKPEHNWIWSAQGIVDMHRPEKWGYVQFSTQAPGIEQFRPDPAASTRDHLQTIYYAQKDFKAKHKRWAATLEELNLTATDFGPGFSPVLQSTATGFEASAVVRVPEGSTQRWHIRQDARVWQE